MYLTGYFQETVDFDHGPGTYNLTSDGDSDIFIAKYKPNGELVWAISFGDSNTDWGAGIAIDDIGNIVVTGYFEGSIDFDPGSGTTSLTSKSN